MLPEFPVFFKDIYDIRDSLNNIDPQMKQDIEDLYLRTHGDPNAAPGEKGHEDDDRKGPSKGDGADGALAAELAAALPEERKRKEAQK